VRIQSLEFESAILSESRPANSCSIAILPPTFFLFAGRTALPQSRAGIYQEGPIRAGTTQASPTFSPKIHRYSLISVDTIGSESQNPVVRYDGKPLSLPSAPNRFIGRRADSPRPLRSGSKTFRRSMAEFYLSGK